MPQVLFYESFLVLYEAWPVLHTNLEIASAHFWIATGFTFGLAHVVQHPGPSFVEHVLQKHHLSTARLHSSHQAERNVLTPATTGTKGFMVLQILIYSPICKWNQSVGVYGWVQVTSCYLSAQPWPIVCRIWNICWKWLAWPLSVFKTQTNKSWYDLKWCERTQIRSDWTVWLVNCRWTKYSF